MAATDQDNHTDEHTNEHATSDRYTDKHANPDHDVYCHGPTHRTADCDRNVTPHTIICP